MGRINFDINSKVIVVFAEILVRGIVVRPKMALDTGATYTMIPLEIVEILGLDPAVGEKTEIITASGVEKVPIVELEKVRVAGAEAKSVKAIVHDLPQKSYVDGLLGLSFLKNFNLNINFKDGFLELNP